MKKINQSAPGRWTTPAAITSPAALTVVADDETNPDSSEGCIGAKAAAAIAKLDADRAALAPKAEAAAEPPAAE
jgi:hypothetical protein